MRYIFCIKLETNILTRILITHLVGFPSFYFQFFLPYGQPCAFWRLPSDASWLALGPPAYWKAVGGNCLHTAGCGPLTLPPPWLGHLTYRISGRKNSILVSYSVSNVKVLYPIICAFLTLLPKYSLEGGWRLLPSLSRRPAILPLYWIAGPPLPLPSLFSWWLHSRESSWTGSGDPVGQ